MTLPTMLVIGAMKSGTTTLYNDLRSHPGIFFPEDKEPGNLSSDEVLTRSGREEYARMFRKARADQLCAEASTVYSKLPDFPGVASRALDVLGPDLRLLYIVRNPIGKIVSQYRHELRNRRPGVSADIDEAIRGDRRYIDYSRYAMQAEPWIQTFGRERLLVIKFEEYVVDRRSALAAIQTFLGLRPLPDLVQPDERFNESGVEPVPPPTLRRLSRSRVYRSVLRPMLGPSARRRLRLRFLPRPAEQPALPSSATIDYAIEELGDDLERQPALFGSARRLWSEGELREGRT